MRKVLLSLVAIAAITIPALAGKFNKVVSVGDKAPTFSGLPAIHNGEETSVSLSDLKDDVVVLVFLANHCPVVKAYEDRLIEFTNDYKSKGVRVVGIAVSLMDGDKLPGIKEYTKDKKSNYVYGYDETQAVGKAYGAVATPQFFVLDKERTIRYTGAMDDNQAEGKVTKTYLRDAVDAVLKGETPSEVETQAKGCGISYQNKKN
jgi:thiol-disulfide isomerase/thioredoxin